MYKRAAEIMNEYMLYSEKKFGLHATSLLLAFVLMGIAAVYVTPALVARQHGIGYAAISVNPFDLSFESNLRFRILTPLLAYLTGLRGSLYIIFPLIMALFFLAVIYFYIRRSIGVIHGVLITMLICFSTPVLFLLHFQGYTDATSYLLIMLMIIFIKKPVVWIPLLVLLLFNHDSNLFIVPGLLFFYYLNAEKRSGAIMYAIVGTVIAVIPFYLYREYISEMAPVKYDISFYISQIRENIRSLAAYFYVGLFYSFKLFWIFPILGFYYYWKEKNRDQLLLFALIFFGVLAQLIFASDTSRLIGLAFPLVIWGAVKTNEVLGKDLFLKGTFYLILLNFLIPQFYVGQFVMIRFHPLPSSLFLKYFFGIETWAG